MLNSVYGFVLVKRSISIWSSDEMEYKDLKVLIKWSIKIWSSNKGKYQDLEYLEFRKKRV